MDNPHVFVGETKFNKGLIANGKILKDEIIAVFDGDTFESDLASKLPEGIADRAVQTSPNSWKNSKGFACFINHSCEPNVGYKNNDTLVAMREIQPGEELLLDYDMSENSDWVMDCECGTTSCRKFIGHYDNHAELLKNKYGIYISSWLRDK